MSQPSQPSQPGQPSQPDPELTNYDGPPRDDGPGFSSGLLLGLAASLAGRTRAREEAARGANAAAAVQGSDHPLTPLRQPGGTIHPPMALAMWLRDLTGLTRLFLVIGLAALLLGSVFLGPVKGALAAVTVWLWWLAAWSIRLIGTGHERDVDIDYFLTEPARRGKATKRRLLIPLAPLFVLAGFVLLLGILPGTVLECPARPLILLPEPVLQALGFTAMCG